MKTSSVIFMGHGKSEPIGLGYIYASFCSHGYNVMMRSNYELEVRSIDFKETISLFSATTPEWNKILYLNQKAKKRNNITIVGGYHVTGLYHAGYDLKSLDFDYIVVGEGEEVIMHVFEDIKKQSSINTSGHPKIFIADQIKDIDSIPFQKRNPDILKDYKIHDLMLPTVSKQKYSATVLGSRGCGYNCSYCASSSMWGSKVRLRNPDNIIEEIKQLKAEFQTNTIIFIDQCFGVNEKWTNELCHRIIKEKLGINWYIQTSVNIKPKLIPLMAEAGCTKMGFGVESLSQELLAKIKPGHCKPLEEVNGLLQFCNKNGILTKAYLMLGFPWETKEFLENYLNDIRLLEANNIKICFFTPFPGTQDWELYKNQLVTNDWSDFDTIKMPVVRNPHITVEEYLEYREMLFHNFYSSQRYKQVTLELLDDHPKFTQSFVEFYEFLRQYRMIPMGTGLYEWLPITQYARV